MKILHNSLLLKKTKKYELQMFFHKKGPPFCGERTKKEAVAYCYSSGI